jgi:hypothetical protein
MLDSCCLRAIPRGAGVGDSLLFIRGGQDDGAVDTKDRSRASPAGNRQCARVHEPGGCCSLGWDRSADLARLGDRATTAMVWTDLPTGGGMDVRRS